MATKSKSTDVFKGLISWLCMMLVFCAVTTAITGLVGVIFDPVLSQDAANLLNYAERNQNIPSEFLVSAICSIALFIASLLFIFLFRKDRKQFEAMIAKALARVWMEVKLFLIFLLLTLSFFLETAVSQRPFGKFLFTGLVLILYFLCLDIGHNRRFFSQNIIHSILKTMNSYSHMTSFEQRSIRRLFSCLIVIVGVGAVSVIGAAILSNTPFHGIWPFRGLSFLGIGVFAAVSIIGTIFWYTLALKRDLRDWNILMAQIKEMYGGNLNAVNHIPPTSNLYDCAMQLNMIRTGIQKAVEEGVKADRTKVELITNVSHDIKTPLTSIISYIELLKKEEGLPPHVMDYISTISQKAERLGIIVQDVFEVSKAATGNISLNLEVLDIGKLLKQTMAEMEETMAGASLEWRIEIPSYPILVHTDGQRMYRVFQNLIRNCAQYSLEGSRAYVTVSLENGFAKVCIRNVSRTEITVSSEDLTARFVRGDQNRTTEGSGLGLSIAKSFTEACGGTFSLQTDKDLFIVTVQFPAVIKQSSPPPSAFSEPLPSPGASEPLEAEGSLLPSSKDEDPSEKILI